MNGNVAASASRSTPSRPEPFRFSPRPNLAHTIQWRPWGKAAFAAASQEDKPVFLVISSSWCEWCRIMDETTLSHASVIEIVNRDYIPIRVDSDLRPDVNQRYNQNGWPSVVLLSAEGEILWGGVYVPPKQMLYYLGHVRRYYGEHRQEISEQARELQSRRLTRQITHTVSSQLDGQQSVAPEQRPAVADIPAQASAVLCELYDEEYGGFTIHPHLKFPHPEALELFLHQAPQRPELLEKVCYSLSQMCEGGLWDNEGGGFFRYSASSDWSMPHTEKMLDENAALLRLLVLTAQETHEKRWYDLARHLLLYCNQTLWQPDLGVFSGSQAADEEYYEPGPYSRASREAPHIDTTIYTAWNARMISAYFQAARILNYPSLSSLALRALDYLVKHMMHPEGSVYHYATDGHAELPGQLADQVWMTRALLDAYELFHHKYHLEAAIALMHFACQELLDRHNGLFYDYPADPDAVGRLAWRQRPLTENSLAAECLLRMAAYSKRTHLRETALRVLSACLEKYRCTGIQGVVYACVVAQAIKNGWL